MDRNSHHFRFLPCILIAISMQWLTNTQSCYSQFVPDDIVLDVQEQLSLTSIDSSAVRGMLVALIQLKADTQKGTGGWTTDAGGKSASEVLTALQAFATSQTRNSILSGLTYLNAAKHAKTISATEIKTLSDDFAATSVDQFLDAKDRAAGKKLAEQVLSGDPREAIRGKRNWKRSTDLFGNGSESDKYWFDYFGVAFFQPKMRIYFDTGSDNPKKVRADGTIEKNGEVDFFQDGSLLPAVEILEFQARNQIGNKYSPWFHGPNLGFGITSSTHLNVETDDGAGNIIKTTESLNSPSLLIDMGWSIDYILEPNMLATSSSVALEFGYTLGISADEGLDDFDDGAIFVGVVYSVAF